MKKALALILAAAMACSLVLTGCGGGTSTTGSASTGAAAGAKSLTLATGGTTGTYYAVGGVMSTVLNKKLTNSSLTVTSTGASKANIQLIADGEADLAIVQNDVMHYASTGTDLFEAEGKYDTFSSVCGMYDETVQLVTTNANIKSVKDLKGKTVAVSSGTSSEIILEQALARAGMTMDDINTVEMTVDGMTTAMISGQIDAAASWSPNTVTLQNALGDNYVDLGTNADFLDSAIFPSSYICTPEYAEANHDILVRFAQALDKAHDWRAAHPEEMAKLLAKELDAPEDTMLAAVGEADWQTITEVCGDMDAIKTVYETQQGIFLDNGTITENVPVEDYVLFDVMQEAYDAYSAAK